MVDHVNVALLKVADSRGDFGGFSLQRSSTRSLQERSLDIGRALKSVNLIPSSVDCRANVELFNHQCFERNAKICEPLDIEVKKPRICGRQIMRDNVEAETGRLL